MIQFPVKEPLTVSDTAAIHPPCVVMDLYDDKSLEFVILRYDRNEERGGPVDGTETYIGRWRPDDLAIPHGRGEAFLEVKGREEPLKLRGVYLEVNAFIRSFHPITKRDAMKAPADLGSQELWPHIWTATRPRHANA